MNERILQFSLAQNFRRAAKKEGKKKGHNKNQYLPVNIAHSEAL